MPRPLERNEATTFPLPLPYPVRGGGGTTACLGCLRASSTIVPVPLLASHAPLCARPALVLFFPFRPVVAPHLLFSLRFAHDAPPHAPVTRRRYHNTHRGPAASHTRALPCCFSLPCFPPSRAPLSVLKTSQKPPVLRAPALPRPRAPLLYLSRPFEVVHDSLRPCPAAKLSSSLPRSLAAPRSTTRDRVPFSFSFSAPDFPPPSQPCPLISRG